MVEALQRGPHARDDLVTGEQPGSRERRPPAVPAQRGPTRPSQPELLDGDIATGQRATAAHLPQAGPDVTGYQAGPPLPEHPEPAGYSGVPPLTDGPGYPTGLAEPAEDFTAGYAAEPTPDFAAERSPRHSRPPAGRRSGGHRAPAGAGYPDDLEPYPGEPGAAGYADEPADGYLGDDTLLAPGYPEYPDDGDDYQPYPGELPATEYDPPVRPYVTDTDDVDEPFAEDPPERPKPRGRRRGGSSPDSFPYGPPPADDEPRQRGRYPGRH
jgi:hypothetical protein